MMVSPRHGMFAVVLILSVPSLMQLALGTCLLAEVRHAQVLAKQSLECEQRVLLPLKLNTIFLSALSHLSAHYLDLSEEHLTGIGTMEAESKEILGLLARASEADARPIVTRLRSLHSQYFDLIRQIGHGDSHNLKPHLTQMLTGKNVLRELLALLEQYNQVEMKLVHTTSSELSRTRYAVTSLLVANCLSAVILATIVCSLINKFYASRLTMLVENTERIAIGQALHPPMTGQDEVAALDAAVHTLNRSLKAADSFRQEIVNMLGHDLRSPLMGVGLLLEQITCGMHAQLTQKELEGVAATVRGVNSLVCLINDLLDAEKMRAGKLEFRPQPILLQPLLEECRERLVDFAARRRIRIEIGGETNLTVLADPQRIAQVFGNLISNAIKFSPPASTIKISVSAHDSYCRVSVIDEGSGASESDRQRIFQRFTQADNGVSAPLHGSGLGLSIARAIVESHGGQIGVSASPNGSGACFWLTLPTATPNR